MMQMYHDSRSLDCRSPFGAVRCGDVVRLRVYCRDYPRSVSIVFQVNGQSYPLPLQIADHDAYELRLHAPQFPCVIWYYFSAVLSNGETKYLGNAGDNLGGVGEIYDSVPPFFQLTVYSRDYNPPEFLRQGIMYQIFPDRFCASRPPFYTREDIFLHEKWDDIPLAQYDPRNEPTHAQDFFGGDLKGITSKLDYLQSLHITVLYLNPIFQAHSNHRYDTGDYSVVDPMLGTAEDLRKLCSEAEKRGIRVLLDGVFSHTGDDSLYFNRYGNYQSIGAWQRQDSLFYPWYTFRNYPDDYKCWWNVKALPEINKDDEDYRQFILGDNGIARRWLKCGTSGWRLDVADELPMSFLQELRKAVKAEKSDAALLGEVWEDASNKVSYGVMRCYCLGDTLDSVMNYPLRKAAIDFVCGKIDATRLCREIASLHENYPPPFFYSLMNLMGSHDRARILNVLAGECWEDIDPLDRGQYRLSDTQKKLAVARLRELWKLYAALPGMPSLYYGDEAGMEGASDPYCRGTFPWGRENTEIMEITRSALALRAARPVLRTGDFSITVVSPTQVRVSRFTHEGFDVFGKEIADDDYDVIVSSVPSP